MKYTKVFVITIIFFLVYFVYRTINDNKNTRKDSVNPNVKMDSENVTSDNYDVKTDSDMSTEKENIEVEKTTPVLYTIDEISLHNSESDCWLLVENKVYDVSEFVSNHPGGKAILEGCGKDSTELYQTRPMGSGTPHSERAQTKLVDYYIGDLD